MHIADFLFLGGHVRPESLATFAKFGDRLDVANEIAKFEIENAAAVAKLVQELDIDCDFEEITSSNAYLDQNLADAAKDLRNRLADMGYEVAGRFTYHEADTAADVTGVPGAKGAMTFPAACIWYVLILQRCTQADLHAGLTNSSCICSPWLFRKASTCKPTRPF